MSGFASTTDLSDKTISFEELGPGLYGYTAEGDPNSGVVIGDDSVLVVDAQATPAMAADVIARIRTVTDKPVRHVVLSHYHAVRVLGASGYEGAEIIASDVTRALIVERGQQDMDSEIGRFPRLFRGKESIPGLTWPDITFQKKMTLWLGAREVQIIHIGRSHTAGDTVVWLPKEKVCFAGDTVEFGATPYCGDAHFGDWPGTLDSLRQLGAERLVPGRGRSLMNARDVEAGIAGTAAFTGDLFGLAKQAVAAGHDLQRFYADAMAAMRPKYGQWVIFEHCMPFNVSRSFDEARGLDRPQIWTAERDVEMWRALEGKQPMKSAEVHG
ncbi:glyoxylase-like metal-dependent hydrolase (beta-lactamase superfamily II) [Humitalea rosea]|uniref:Glyoxylase-like metal-dependent hydrolase (Beta-lactamase superfamily II) n=1 Tax=Humitalea rosea TaxID=990373 RepID=A0A2W7HYI6_9PROT|nr:MBL fold metallo-hydrolase [Humitalea rosea]PZW37738.1 glyoxylase-like metal-dependent hydrolase (beta-lactamase superfamily II) [Humitalea rosea]